MRLETKSVSAGYGKHIVIPELSISIPKGEIVSLIGANGSGKSTILKALARLLKTSGGTVYLDGEDIHRIDGRRLAKRLSILPQLHHAPEDLSVDDFVSYGRFPHNRAWTGFTAKDREAIGQALELTCLKKLKHRRMATLSGGERQRAWIALNLAQEPQTMLLDEPTTFLDVRHQHETLELIQRMNKTLGLTIVMVLHDINHATRCSHRIIAIKDGEVFREGPPRELISSELLLEVFGIAAQIIEHDGIPYFIPSKPAHD
ncbi:MAG: hypothetical protein A2X49_15860 [Lentisphaerae bacterium GWF2_52_8]|nr:MAG: hypothetical protein A2X49_15860 [Lentisphaerae bacterium GWF2_52_8]